MRFTPRRTRTRGRYARLALSVALLAIPFSGRAAEPANTTANETNKATDWKTATRITKKCRDAAPRAVLEELAKAADVTLDAGVAANWRSAGSITLDVQDRPFWPVFIDACRQARAEFDTECITDMTPRHIGVGPNGENSLASMPTCEAGGCLVIFESADCTRHIQYGSSSGRSVRNARSRGAQVIQGDATNRTSAQFTLRALVLVDPKLRPIGDSVFVTLTTAVDENGTTLLLPNYDRSGLAPSGELRKFFLQTSFTLYYPTNLGKKIAKLQGVLRIPTALEDQTWEISDVLNTKPVSKDLGDRSITVQSVRQLAAFPDGGPMLYDVRISEKISAGREAPGLRRSPYSLSQLAQSLTLVDTNGTEVKPRRDDGGSGASEMEVSILANKDFVPSKLVWKVPTKARDLVMPFAITDLPIP